MELTELRRKMEACHRDRAGRRRFHESLKAEIASYARSRRQVGEEIPRLSEALGVRDNQLYRWMRHYREGVAAFLPVRVLEQAGTVPEQAVLERPIPPTLRLISPSGWTVEGLDVQTLSVLLLRLS
jgi:transposase-like protein